MKLTDPVILRDCLYNCATECTQHKTFDGIDGLHPTQCYGQGIVNGMVAAFMSLGMDFAHALALVMAHAPDTLDPNCLPSSWRVAAKKPKKPYTPPTLTTYGTLTDITEAVERHGDRDGATGQHHRTRA